MHFVVCVKQVPDSAQIRVHPVTNTIMRQGVPAIVNPYDLHAIEEALRLRDRLGGGTITAVTMGPPMAEEALRKTLTLGVDRAVLLTDRQFAGSDTLATSYALASAITRIGERWGRPSIVFTGKQTIDGDTAQVGPGVAKRLGFTQLTYVLRIRDIDAASGRLIVERRAEGGVQILSSRMPVLITMLEGSNEIRRGTMADALRATRAEVFRWNAAEAGIADTSMCGLRGSPTVVKSVFAPGPRAQKAKHVPVENTPVGEVAGGLLDEIFARKPELRANLDAGERSR